MSQWRGVYLFLQLSTLLILDSLTLSAGDWLSFYDSWHSNQSKYTQEKGFWLSESQYMFDHFTKPLQEYPRTFFLIIRGVLTSKIWSVGRPNSWPLRLPYLYNPETAIRDLDRMAPPTNFLTVLRAFRDMEAAVEEIFKSNSSSPEQRSAILQFQQRYRNNKLIHEHTNTFLKNLEDFSPLYWKMVSQENPNSERFQNPVDTLETMMENAYGLEFIMRYLEYPTYNETFYDILTADFTRKLHFPVVEYCKWRLRVCFRTFTRDHINRFNKINNQSLQPSGNSSLIKELLNKVTADMSTVFSRWYPDYDFVIMLMRERVGGMNSSFGMEKVAIEIENTSAVLVYRRRAAETPTNQLSQRKFNQLLRYIADKTYSQVNTGNVISDWISDNAMLTFYWLLILREGAAYSVNTTENLTMLSYFPSLQTQFSQTALRRSESILADFQLHIVF